uniref:Si:dkey-29p10.4 n=1 Tax=Lepisosteus oculatus TaxID=7918 RepID=W5MHD5_LEPOC|nr:PREDICTED: E3 ubiquitin/ISG15 ligase TRIM25-like [Lepisosteus oculatus]
MAKMGAALERLGVQPECPLCHRECRQPTTLRCGHLFCQGCIQEVWSTSQTGPYYCPECRAEYRKLPALGGEREQPSAPATEAERPSTSSTVPCNYCITSSRPAVKTCLVCGASMCAEHLKIHLEVAVFQGHPLVQPTADISLWKCVEHQEMLKIYCRECEECICTMCTLVGAHKGHQCVGVGEAEQELRGKLKEGMIKIQENVQIVEDRLTLLQEKKLNIQLAVSQARAHVQQQYEAMRAALDAEEQLALQSLSREESRALGDIEAQLEQLQDTLQLTQKNMGALESLSDTRGTSRIRDQAFVLEYSKISKSMRQMCSPVEELTPPRELDQMRLDRLQEWTDRRLDTVSLTTGTDRDSLRVLYGTVPSLNPDTAYPKLALADGNRGVSYREEPQPYPPSTARFSNFPQVLGAEPREGGRAYWEVEIQGAGRWKVGVCDARIGRKGTEDACRLGYNAHSWCLYGEQGRLEALHNRVAFPLEASPPQRVGVLLDFEGGLLSFYSVDEGSLLPLHSFQEKFTQPLYPALAASRTQLTFCSLFQ